MATMGVKGLTVSVDPATQWRSIADAVI